MIFKPVKNKNVADDVRLIMAGENIFKYSFEPLRGVPAGRAAPAGASDTLYW